MSAEARSEQQKVTLIYRVLVLLLILLIPWGGLWRGEPTGEAIRFSAYNAVLALVLAYVLAAVEQVIVRGTARLLGDRVFWARFGVGPVMFVRTRGVRHLQVHAFPSVNQFVIVSARAKRQAARFALALLAGAVIVGMPAILTLAGVVHAPQTLLTERLAPDVLAVTIGGIFAGWEVLVAIELLLSSEGAESLNLKRRTLYWTDEAASFFERHAFEQAAAAAQRGLAEVPDEPVLQFILASARGGTYADSDEAYALATQLRNRELPSYLRAGVLNLWSWQAYLHGDTSSGAAADEATREALELMPMQPSLMDTRGHVLMWLGRAAEAEATLREAYERANHESTRASSAAGLAMVYAATKRPDEAATWLARAREHGCEQRLLARAVASVDPLHRD